MRKIISTGNEQRYEEWLSIELQHEYYGNAPCPATLVPDEETACLLKRNNILWKSHASQCLLLAGSKFSLPVEEELYLRFDIRNTGEQFHYVSHSCEESEAFSIAESGIAGVWKTIVLDVSSIIRNNLKHLPVHIRATEKYIEYLCIPKYGREDLKLQMTDDKDYFSLINPPEQLSLPAMPVVWRFVSKEKITLKQRVEAKTKLCEIRNYGERIIGNAIPFPRPEQFSPVSPRDTITTFFYY
ncbi:MAG: hypothetical protein LBR81_06410 [Prevotellaceae bacterium]|jgi:hypothetical protein|nr:hypothetical protein [Prevotellaceae bacterium]